jgi:hypothetical protein
MSKKRQRTFGDPPASQADNKSPGPRFPVHHEIHKLQAKLTAFNERIEELEGEGHHGHAMEVLKANAIDFARRIDELRCLLVESAPKRTSPAAILKDQSEN